MVLHSKLGASSMHRWAPCPGSVRLSEGLDSKSSDYAKEGTLAHDASAALIEGKPTSEITEEMREAISPYVDYVLGLKSTADVVFIEHRFVLDSVHPGLFGTADAVTYHEMEKLLRVVDLKFGAGIPVEVFEDGKPNLQLAYYGLGALLSTGFKVSEVELVIVQPRCPHPDGPIRKHRLSAIELLDFAADLVEAAKRTEDPNAALVPGDHCRFCPAAAICPELHKKSVALAQQEFTPAFTYDPEKLAKTLDMLPVMEAWIKNVREFAYREAEHGRTPPGWKLVEKRATRKWTNEDEVGSTLQKYDRELWEESFETKLKSPAAIEKIMGKKEFEHVLGHTILKESSGHTLAPESDKRPAIQLNAARAFQEADFEELV
jgi:hypothetical protein